MRATILIHHTDWRVARRGIAELSELTFDRARIGGITLDALPHERFRNTQARQFLCDRVHARKLSHPLVKTDGDSASLKIAGKAAFGIARKIEVIINRCPKLQISEVHAWLSKALHRHEAHHCACPLRACRGATSTAECGALAASSEIGARAPPFAGERARDLRRDTCFSFLPLRRLRTSILNAQNVVAPLFETGRFATDIVLVVQAFGNPHIGDGKG